MAEGLVVAYADDMKMGVIKTDEGGRFVFASTDWLPTEIHPVAGMRVSFEPSLGNASRITVAGKTATTGTQAS